MSKQKAPPKVPDKDKVQDTHRKPTNQNPDPARTLHLRKQRRAR